MVQKILGYVLLHRHGQRAPIRNIFKTNHEIDIWNSLLPSNLLLNSLDFKFPTVSLQRYKDITNTTTGIPSTSFLQYDIKYKPFSCLTTIGINSMIEIGKEIKKNFPLINQSKNLRIYSTNYHRTQVILILYF